MKWYRGVYTFTMCLCGTHCQFLLTAIQGELNIVLTNLANLLVKRSPSICIHKLSLQYNCKANGLRTITFITKKSNKKAVKNLTTQQFNHQKSYLQLFHKLLIIPKITLVKYPENVCPRKYDENNFSLYAIFRFSKPSSKYCSI